MGQIRQRTDRDHIVSAADKVEKHVNRQGENDIYLGRVEQSTRLESQLTQPISGAFQ